MSEANLSPEYKYPVTAAISTLSLKRPTIF
jgi:hypothetical protein